MKVVLFSLGLLLFATAAVAQSHVVIRDNDGRRIATTQEEPGGGTSLRARDGSVIGRVDQHGIIRDRSGKRIGSITARRN